jgi:hypothetical protein
VSELADEIDRTALCIHTLARADGRVRAHMESIRAPVPSLVIAMATVLVKRPFTFDDVQLVQRYTAPDDLRRIVDAHVRAAMFAIDGDGYVATDVFRDAAAFVLANQGGLITELWRGADPSLVESIVGAVDDTDAPAFRQQRDALPDPVGPEHRLLRLVTVLRYLRADVHAAALERSGISIADAPDIDRRWRDGEPIPSRDAAEAATDAAFVARLGGHHDELLALLRALPGEDPRRH